jgi:hypothetical protein
VQTILVPELQNAGPLRGLFGNMNDPSTSPTAVENLACCREGQGTAAGIWKNFDCCATGQLYTTKICPANGANNGFVIASTFWVWDAS